MNTERFREQVRSYRAPTGKTQQDLAKALALSPQVLSYKLHGIRNAYLTHREVQTIIKTLVAWGAMSTQAQARELLDLMDCPDFSPSEWQAAPLRRLEQAPNRHSVQVHNVRIPVVEYEVPASESNAPPSLVLEKAEEEEAASRLPRMDWGEAMDVSSFYGREQELVELERWIVGDRCRLVDLLGRGGLGKTALSIKLAQQIAPHFDFVFWRSLQNAPPLEDLLAECIAFLSRQQKTGLPENGDAGITFLLHYLRKARCLLVLDNVETILQEGDRAGHYRAGYEGYGHLFQRVGQAAHHSCLLLTSREKPKEMTPLEGPDLQVRTLVLTGLEQRACQQLLQERAVFGPEQASHDLIARYDGNPLTLQLVASTIREVFGGDIAEFLKQSEMVFGSIRDVLDQQFERLSILEKVILGWLALAREWVTFADLVEESAHTVSRKELLEALEALRRRCMLERGEAGASFSLHPVVMEYVTEWVVEQVTQEIASGQLILLLSHALMKAQAREYVRHAQVELILKPVLEQLQMRLKSEQTIEQKLMHVLAILRNKTRREQRYGAGNVINLLYQLKGTLRGCDFSRLHIQQASLVGVNLQDASFVGSSFARCVFSETFCSIFSVAISPDGQHVAAGSVNGEVGMWQVVDGRQIMILTVLEGCVWSVAFSPDGSLLASGGEDRIVRIWEVSTGRCLMMLHGHTDWIRSVSFSPNSSLLTSSSDDGTIRLWELSTGECLRTLQRDHERIWSVAFSPDGSLLASSSDDRTVRVWEVSTGHCIKTLQGHTDFIRAVAFSPDGTLLASGGYETTVRLWQVNSGQCLTMLQGHTDRVWSVAFSPDGSLLASSSDDRTVRVWEVSTGHYIKTLQGHTGRIWSVAFSPDGIHLISGSDDWTIRLWQVNSGQCLATLRGHDIWTTSAAFSPDGTRFTTGSHDPTMKVWEVSTGECLMTLRGHTNWVEAVAWSSDGTLLASGSHDTTVRIWQVSTGACLKILQGHTDFVRAVAFSPDGTLLASGSYDTTVRLWEVSTGVCAQTLRGHTDWMGLLAFSPEGSLLASANRDQTVRLWDVRTGACLKTLHGHTDWVESVAFSPGGALLVSGGHNGTVSVWEVSSGMCLRMWQQHQSRVWAVAFSSDESTVVSVSEDRTILRWHVRTGECLQMVRNRLYERMNITGITGLTEAQKAALRALGAVEEEARGSQAEVLQQAVQ